MRVDDVEEKEFAEEQETWMPEWTVTRLGLVYKAGTVSLSSPHLDMC